MGQRCEGIDERLAAFPRSQRLLSVATAPLARGRFNMPPKGATESVFGILGPGSAAARTPAGPAE